MKSLFFLFFSLFVWGVSVSQTILIGNSGDYPNLEAASQYIQAGDTLLLQEQIFSDGTQSLNNINGTDLQPIVIIAENQHKSIFRGGTEAIHLSNCSYIEINGIVVEGQTGNGINIDDGGNYVTPTKHITIRNCIFQNLAGTGNNDFLKMSGVDSFLVEQCEFAYGNEGGSGVDMVGCHWGTIQDNYFEQPGVTGIQNKGGTRYIRMQRNIFKDVSQRAINLGGNTGIEYFRPPLSEPIENAYEAADLEVFSNIFISCKAPIAFVGCVRVHVFNNTIYNPGKWVMRILQETAVEGFLPCSYNEFKNNLIHVSKDLTTVNIGPHTAPETFQFSNNLWYHSMNVNWIPILPVEDKNSIIAQPLFEDKNDENFRLLANSPAIGMGAILKEPKVDYDQNEYREPPSIGAFEGNLTVSLSELSENTFALFPNPAKNYIHLTGKMENIHVYLINSVGMPVQVLENNNLPIKLNTEKLYNGIYHVLVLSKSDERIYWRKFAVMGK